jgi:hypothetical protein
MSTVPLDYRTYTSIVERAASRQRVRKLASLSEALASLVATEPTPAHEAAYARYTRARTPIQKQAPGPPPPPMVTAHEEFTARIDALQQTTPTLTKAQAIEQIAPADPALWERRRQAHVYGREMPPPVAKEAPPRYEAILKMATDRAAQTPGLTRRAVLMTLAQEDPARYYAAYQRYHLTDGVHDHHAAVLAKSHDAAKEGI